MTDHTPNVVIIPYDVDDHTNFRLPEEIKIQTKSTPLKQHPFRCVHRDHFPGELESWLSEPVSEDEEEQDSIFTATGSNPLDNLDDTFDDCSDEELLCQLVQQQANIDFEDNEYEPQSEDDLFGHYTTNSSIQENSFSWSIEDMADLMPVDISTSTEKLKAQECLSPPLSPPSSCSKLKKSDDFFAPHNLIVPSPWVLRERNQSTFSNSASPRKMRVAFSPVKETD